MSIISDLRDAVNEAARALTNEANSTFSTSEVADWLKRNRGTSWERFEPSFQANFSALTRDPDCIIERVPGRFLYQIAAEEPQDNVVGQEGGEDAAAAMCNGGSGIPDVIEPTRSQRENKLYALLRVWLASRGYQAAITATGRRGNIWGNPDV